MRVFFSFLLVLSWALTGCITPGESELADEPLTIRGSVSYRERIALTPESVLLVELSEVSSRGEHRKTVATTRIENPGPVPIPFEITIPAGDVRAVKHYGVTAVIEHDGRVLFSQREPYPVLTRGYSTVATIELFMAPNE